MVLIMTLLFACGEKSTDEPSNEDTAVDTSVETPDFVGMDFLLESSEGYPTIGDSISLDFPGMDGDLVQFNFRAACNSLGGSFLFEDGVMNVQEMSMTEMGCAQDLMDQDDWFVAFWGAQPSLSLNGDLLTVSDGTHTFHFRDSEVVTPNMPLEDVTWVIDTFIEDDAASTFSLDVSPSVEFRSDGTISLYTGCNDGTGTYSLDGNMILVSMEWYTEAGCADDNSQEAEAHIVSLFMNDLVYSIDANRIHLMSVSTGVSGLVSE